MSILQATGFEDGVLPSYMTIITSTPAVSSTNARTGTYCLAVGGANGQDVRHNWEVSLTEGWIYLGVRLMVIQIAAGNGGYRIYFQENGTTHFSLTWRSDGRVDLCNSAGTILQTGSLVHSAATYIGMAVKFKIDDSAGYVKVRWNGLTTDDINYSGDTRNGGSGVVNQTLYETIGFTIGSNDANALKIDDIVIQDTNGVAPENDWLVDPACYPHATASDEASTGYVVGGSSPAGTLEDSIDETPSDEGVTTIESSAVNDFASFNMASAPSGIGTFYAYVVEMRADKTAAGVRSIQGRVKLGSTVVTGSGIALSSSGFRTLQAIFHRDPDGNVLTAANVSNFKVGVKTSV